MDTYMTFTVYGENSEKTAEKCIDEIKRLDSLLSAENEESEISFINSQKRVQAFRRACRYYRKIP